MDADVERPSRYCRRTVVAPFQSAPDRRLHSAARTRYRHCQREGLDATIRAKADLHYELVLGPFCDGDMVSAYWRVTATLGGKTAVKVGTDFLKVKDGKITDCWTMNNNAA